MLVTRISTVSSAGPALRRLLRKAGEKRAMNAGISTVVGTLVKDHILLKVAPAHHKTADRLGAQYSNKMAKAGDSVIHLADDSAAIVHIQEHPYLFTPTLGPMHIRPGMTFGPVAPDGRGGTGKQWLTIPAVAEAYGKRAREFKNLRFAQKKGQTEKAMLLRVPTYERKADGTRRTRAEAVAYREELKKKTSVLYWLRKHVIIPQDRSLLPSDEAMHAAAKLGANEYFQAALSDAPLA